MFEQGFVMLPNRHPSSPSIMLLMDKGGYEYYGLYITLFFQASEATLEFDSLVGSLSKRLIAVVAKRYGFSEEKIKDFIDACKDADLIVEDCVNSDCFVFREASAYLEYSKQKHEMRVKTGKLGGRPKSNELEF